MLKINTLHIMIWLFGENSEDTAKEITLLLERFLVFL